MLSAVISSNSHITVTVQVAVSQPGPAKSCQPMETPITIPSGNITINAPPVSALIHLTSLGIMLGTWGLVVLSPDILSLGVACAIVLYLAIKLA